MTSGMWDQGRQIAQNVRQNRMIGTCLELIFVILILENSFFIYM